MRPIIGGPSGVEGRRHAHFPISLPHSAFGSKLLAARIEETNDGKFRLAYDPTIAKNLSTPEKPIEDVNLWGLWEAVKPIPTLLIHGMESDILTHETCMQMLKSHPDFSLLEIENVGHAPALMDLRKG